jgi:hypothetical protein
LGYSSSRGVLAAEACSLGHGPGARTLSSSSSSSSTKLRPARLTSIIKAAASTQELLALVQQHSADLDTIHVSAVFIQLKKQQAGLVKQPAAQQLLQHMKQLLATDAFKTKCGA